jgi:peptidoglycan/LPS O-acetylase OafA/YrhL
MAAVAVVLHHAGELLSAPVFGGYVPMHGMFRFGHPGVDFFFVLSGFIISTVHSRDIGRPRALLPYAVKRLTRIYPIYWFATALAIALSGLGLPGDPALTVGSLAPGKLLASLLLLPQHSPPLVNVAWTLWLAWHARGGWRTLVTSAISDTRAKPSQACFQPLHWRASSPASGLLRFALVAPWGFWAQRPMRFTLSMFRSCSLAPFCSRWPAWSEARQVGR